MENRIKSLIKKLDRFGFSVSSKKERNIDPVCGMEASGDLFQAKHQGKNYYFCSDHCKDKFKKEPENYIAK